MKRGDDPGGASAPRRARRAGIAGGTVVIRRPHGDRAIVECVHGDQAFLRTAWGNRYEAPLAELDCDPDQGWDGALPLPCLGGGS
jgi:hypothetical protein